MDRLIAVQPTVDDPDEPIQLRPFDRCRPSISGRDRERHHLSDAVARDVEIPRRFSLAHAISTGHPNFSIQIHGETPPALPVARNGKGGRLLSCPQQGHPAATVADFRTAVVTHYRQANCHSEPSSIDNACRLVGPDLVAEPVSKASRH